MTTAAYTLPDLLYDCAALEPYIPDMVMGLHHDRHHTNYVGGVNATLEKLEATRESGDLAATNLYEKNPAFNLDGHTSHMIFWQNMIPDAQEHPEGELAAVIDEYFGSFEKFRGQFVTAAPRLQGLGQGVLAWDTLPKCLVTSQLTDQQGNIPVATVPLLVPDMWEHAFYLDCQNVETDYVKARWNVVSWAGVATRFKRARTQYTGLVLA